MNRRFNSSSRRKIALGLAAGFATLLAAIPLIYAQQRGGGGRGAAPAPHAAPVARSAPVRQAPARVVERSDHGSVRHADAHVVARPEARPEARVDVQRNVGARREVEADIHGRRGWDDFHYGQRLHDLPRGFLALNFGGLPYFYNDGIYYQSADDGYQEVYPPVGAEIPQPPDGAIEVDFGGQQYDYAGGAFYLQQSDGSFAIVPPPIGAIVPELPPGAAQVSLNGTVAYQFNGVYYQPVFANGVTQYETVAP